MMLGAWIGPAQFVLFVFGRARRPPVRHLSLVHRLFMIRKRHDGRKIRRDSGPFIERASREGVYKSPPPDTLIKSHFLSVFLLSVPL